MGTPKPPPKVLISLLDLRKYCPRQHRPMLDRIIERRRRYLTRLNYYKENVPPIDWDHYKRNVRIEFVSLVEDFQKKYEAFVVPYPEDKYTPQADKLRLEVLKEIDDFKKESKERIAGYEREMEEITNLLPFDRMTMEDYCIMYPDEAPDFINKPSFWPHDPPEQLGYVEKKYHEGRHEDPEEEDELKEALQALKSKKKPKKKSKK